METEIRSKRNYTAMLLPDRQGVLPLKTIIPSHSSEVDAVASLRENDHRKAFGAAEQFLLDQARERFDFEQKSAGTLHAKSTLFLAITGIFATTVTALISRLFEVGPTSLLQKAALLVLLASMGSLTVVAILLCRSAMSRSYEVVPTPSQWAEHLIRLRKSYPLARLSSDTGSSVEGEVLIQLKRDVLAGWVTACDASNKVNEEKASRLDSALNLLYASILIAFVGVLLYGFQKLIN